jgi:hypothetical protein
MSRVRSPNYPAISLPEAIEKVRAIRTKEQHLAAPREVIAKHIGFGGINGGSSRVISALMRYGLLEEAGNDRLRVSPLAMQILVPLSSEQRAAAIKEAAEMPPLFQAIVAEYGGTRPSEENLRAYLAHQSFALDAIDRVIQIYKDTVDLVTREFGLPGVASDCSSMYDSPVEEVPLRSEKVTMLGAHAPDRGKLHQAASVQAGVGAFRADAQAVSPNASRATLPLAEGIAAFEMPDRLSAESFEDLKDWMEVMLRRAERAMKRTQQMPTLTAPDPEGAEGA